MLLRRVCRRRQPDWIDTYQDRNSSLGGNLNGIYM